MNDGARLSDTLSSARFHVLATNATSTTLREVIRWAE
jgi:hypothetical protein